MIKPLDKGFVWFFRGDYLFKISLLDSNNHDLRLTVNKNENSGDSRWAGTEYRPQPNQLEKIISTTTNYALSHNYNPNNRATCKLQ